ncbi:F0F1 ATP synthase subunit epsilon [Corynebacterium doosanense]|uniref:ATP synthase epsilon chain n=1 Tax=Corynebacterium doosanense CAU 212 = DSM 45436 TaxID=558173 RepID=A0A097IFE5_9CORY|nr:F0F1 ATP synthase subunit epsilon [Corynebacterium doosanense]AIT60857.1 ATP synthase F0F1 subunit epsilon [Corynebacterium doosanense CAU 212 = DSM 45436]
MAEITVQLVSVDRELWSGQASTVTAQTTEGEIGVLPGHEPLLGQLVNNGVVTITPADGSEKLVAAVQDGFLSVTAEKVTVLADNAIWASEVDEAHSEANLDSEDELEKARAESALKAVRRARGR